MLSQEFLLAISTESVGFVPMTTMHLGAVATATGALHLSPPYAGRSD